MALSDYSNYTIYIIEFYIMSRFNIEDLPKGDFTVAFVADKFYPECIKYDSEGRIYNRAIPTIYRLLRRMRYILEVGNGIFYNAL